MPLSLHPRAEAHGKTILLGEHSVVYGQPALAAAVPQGLELRATALPDPRQTSTFGLSDWDLSLALDVRSEHPVVRACLEVLGHCDGPLTGWAIEGRSRLPPGAGLGSSAALTVALARLALGPDAPHEEVVAASMAGERVFHGEPSGIDSEIAARGGVLRFVRGQTPTAVPLPETLRLLVVPSRIERRTAEQVAKVRSRYERFPTLGPPLVEVLGRSVDRGIEAIQNRDLATLGEIMQIAHEVLSAFAVSCAALDELCSTALRHGALGAKLTGAGGGGCILALPGSDHQTLANAFVADGYEPLLVELHP